MGILNSIAKTFVMCPFLDKTCSPNNCEMYDKDAKECMIKSISTNLTKITKLLEGSR